VNGRLGDDRLGNGGNSSDVDVWDCSVWDDSCCGKGSFKANSVTQERRKEGGSVYPRKSNLFPRHKNNIVENIWCTAVICTVRIKKNFVSPLRRCDDPERVSC
jgi:hypothetical protein